MHLHVPIVTDSQYLSYISIITEPPRDISIQAADFKGLLFGKITFNFIVSNTLIVKIILKKAKCEFIVSTDQLVSLVIDVQYILMCNTYR